MTFFHGVKETLEKIQNMGIKIGIVTSKDIIRTKAILSRLDINFITIQSANGQLRGKPAPDHILIAMVEAKEDPANTIFVGDTLIDCQAATRAGIDYIHAGWGYGDPIENTYTLNSIIDLPNYIM
jgi:HAD superfamily hydrolase (TIGR01549 family)